MTIKLNNTRTILGVRIGSKSIRDSIARDVKLTRRLHRTADKIGNIVCLRISTPKRVNQLDHFIGTTTTLKGNLVSINKLVINPMAGMMCVAARANGKIPAKYVARKDIILTQSDREEIKSVVRACLAEAITDGSWKEGNIPKHLWKAIFRSSRDALGMMRVQSRIESYDADGYQVDSVLVDHACDVLQEEVDETARQSRVLALGRYFRKCIAATYAADKTRKRRALHRTMLATCEIAEAIALGQSVGHGLKSVQRARNLKRDFEAYVAQGASLLRTEPASIAAELTEAFAGRAIE